MIGLQSSGELHLSKGQLLKKANADIERMKMEAEKGMAHIKQQVWQIAQLRMAVTALATHFNQSTEQVKEIYDAFCKKEDERIIAEQQQKIDEAKAKMVEDIKNGKKVEFTAMDLSDGKVTEFKPCN